MQPGEIMAELFAILAFSGLALVVSVAADKKGEALKVNSISAECEPKVSLSASKSESDCSDKCKKDSTCRFAVYQSKEKKCGLVPASSDCVFWGDEFQNVVLGFHYKKMMAHDESVPTDTNELKAKNGKRVFSGRGGGTDQCRDLCDIHPKCQTAYFTAAMGQNGCSFVVKSPLKELKAAISRATNIIYTAA